MESKEQELEMERIQKQCETHERFLKELVRGKYANLQGYLPGDLSFGIARRWNSWYPSYFHVEGGCYVLIPGDIGPDDADNRKDKSIGVVVIDPGFKFIDVLRENYQIEPRDISAVIVTHFHPDHMAGLLEYATIMNTSKQMCNVYLNETTYTTFKSLQNAYVTVNELLDGQIQEIMRYITRDGDYVQVTVSAVGVHHNELGNQHRSIGLILEATRAKSKAFEPATRRYRIGILGDTDGKEDYIPYYVESFHKVDILILHLGTFSNKKLGRGGKHLYIEGVRRVLRQMKSKWEETGSSKKIVVLSEFGLELADEDLLYCKLRPFIESHSWRLPLIFISLYLEKQEKTMAEELDDADGSISRFFARATLGLLERVCKFSEDPMAAYLPTLTEKDIDELLVALTFLVLAFDSPGLRETIRKLKGELGAIDNQRQRQFIDELPLKRYLDFLEKKLVNKTALNPLRAFFQTLAQNGFVQAGSPTGQVIKSRKLLLTKSCESLIARIDHNLEHRANVLYYVDKLPYISKYAESRGIRGYRWVYGNSAGITDLCLFWTAGLVGVFLLREALIAASAEPSPSSDNSLLQIGAFFQKEAEPRANLLVGDIGCTFGMGPSDPDDKEGKQDIKLRSYEGKWISPYDAECFYNTKNERINYRTHKDEKLE